MKQQEQQAGGAQPRLRHDEARSQYELHLDGRIAGKAVYRREGDRLHFTHTEVEPAHEGQGLGSRLAAFALDDVKARGLKAVPQCPFIAKYIAKHEADYGGLVA
jgi:predicted GNAT family acetyltransferase